MEELIMLLLFLVAVVLVFNWINQRSMRPTQQGNVTASSGAKPQTVSKNQMAEDIKATKTSQVVDAVSILDDLTSTSSNYRHYCELVGTSMASGGVTAPYSRRQVAYYDIKCYRLDATYGGGQTETLVAHEHSIDPFFFTDASCDTPVYVDLESFGNNVILVNSTNHVEGPNSEFAQALKKSVGNATSGGVSSAYAAVGQATGRASNMYEARATAKRTNALLGALQGQRTKQALQSEAAFAGAEAARGTNGQPAQSHALIPWRVVGFASHITQAMVGSAQGLSQAADKLCARLQPLLALQPAYAGADALQSGMPPMQDSNSASRTGNHDLPQIKFFGRGGGPNAPSGHGGPSGRGGGPHPQPGRGTPPSRPQININMGYGNRPPQHLGDFMGPYGGGPWVMGGGPGYNRPRPHSNDDAAILLGMGLGALLNSMTSTQQQSAQGYTTSTDTFRGYRLVENVVPLGSPIYCIGEIYRSGSSVFMSRSLAKDYPTSFFATKPETEVLSVIES